MTDKLRMAVVGVGHFGRFHAEKIAGLGRARLVAVSDTDPERAAEVAAAHGAEPVTDYRALIGNVDAVSVAVPTVSHYGVVKDLLEQGIHVLVEKPLAHDLKSAGELVELSERRGVILRVGHLPRFYGETAALRRLVSRPLYIDSVRIAPFKTRGTDVNVVLDLMIHDLDLILSLVDAPVTAVDAAGAPVFTPEEDIATVRLKFANGCIASITASRIGLKTERKMRIFQPNTYLTADFDRQIVSCFRKREGATLPGLAGIDASEERYEAVDALQREVEAFVDVVAGVPPAVEPVSGREALRALEIAMQINDCLRAHARLVAEASGMGPAAPVVP